MEKTDRFTKVAAILVFLALAAYVGYYVWHQLARPVVTAMAVTTTVRESTVASGLVVRDEMLLTGSGGSVQVAVDEGQHVSAGAPLAVELSSEAALTRQSRIQELELEIQRMETLLEEQENRSTLAGGDGAIRTAARDLAAAVARHDMTELDTLALQFSSLVLDREGEAVSQEQLSALRSEYNSLRSAADGDAAWIYAPAAGLFSTIVDGWEGLTQDSVTGLSPSALRALMEEERTPDAAAVGKLVTSYTWYFAAILPAEYASQLSLEQNVDLEFGRHYSGSLSGRVVSRSLAEGDEQVVVLAITDAMADTMAMRRVNAELVLSEHTGIRVPQSAVHKDEETGGAYVYTVTGGQAERKDVEVIYTYQEYCLVAASTDTNALREGNEIIVSAWELYDGMILS